MIYIKCNIGLLRASMKELRSLGLDVSSSTFGLSVQIAEDGSISGSEGGGAPLKGDTIKAIERFITSEKFQDEYVRRFAVKPGQPYASKSAMEILDEAKAHKSWSEMEAKMLVDGISLRDTIAFFGITETKPLD